MISLKTKKRGNQNLSKFFRYVNRKKNEFIIEQNAVTLSGCMPPRALDLADDSKLFHIRIDPVAKTLKMIHKYNLYSVDPPNHNDSVYQMLRDHPSGVLLTRVASAPTNRQLRSQMHDLV
ncbi:hypothetical protein EVAR_22302_1 [Eumeta japonica]|uniref:Uncharacterized protein n=1 Tax=Eumeta variegata TaxID=151549 RepID=A0A4C1UBX4_EUMVA|nr:hypothetical protein EVAR_22302_1 [Eumeta japonica]